MRFRLNPVSVSNLVVLLGLLIASGPVAAAPPMLSGLVVEPDTLMVGTGKQTVNISVRVDDLDGDLQPGSVKLKRIKEGKKNKTLARMGVPPGAKARRA